MTRPDLETVTLYALDVTVGLLKSVHGEHHPAECEVCWHVHDELDRVDAAMRHELAAAFDELAAAA